MKYFNHKGLSIPVDWVYYFCGIVDFIDGRYPEHRPIRYITYTIVLNNCIHLYNSTSFCSRAGEVVSLDLDTEDSNMLDKELAKWKEKHKLYVHGYTRRDWPKLQRILCCDPFDFPPQNFDKKILDDIFEIETKRVHKQINKIL